VPQEAEPALAAWRMMGGVIDWAGLPVVAELIGVKDVEMLVLQLLTIKEYADRGRQ
jgi:hypothetical protein